MTESEIKKMLTNPNQIQWACRRGMLELDVILGKFYTNQFELLDLKEKILFLHLLELPDPLLFAWLLNKEVPENTEWQKIVEKIRGSL